MPTESSSRKHQERVKSVLSSIHKCRYSLAAAALTLLSTPVLYGQISPGPLSRAHRSLSGPTQCATCHKLGAGSEVLKCQECHAEIAQEITQNHGLHAGFSSREDCAKCHSEHNGEDFPLIHWQPSFRAFDHTQTGYTLQGKHAALRCTQCHTTAHISSAERPLIKNLQETFLGLFQQCTNCHEDIHRGQLGQNCLQCHNYVDWKAASKFDHAATRFPLTGLHVQVTCEKCHNSAEPGGPARFTGLPFAKCSDCHTDPHRGAFAKSCEICHTTSGWKRISGSQTFDHSKTNFPLLGKHTEVECTHCHVGANFKKPITHAKCSDCHTDAHDGQFADRKDKRECSSCHTVSGWKPALFSVNEHKATAYPLIGKHEGVSCVQCHLPAGAATRYKIAFGKCLDCHQDAHSGQFGGNPYENQCEKCHTVAGFDLPTFTIAQHQKTRFPLVDSHLTVTCPECHTDVKSRSVLQNGRFRFDDRTCSTCHEDPHHGEFHDRMTQRRPDGSASGCEACHTTKSWTDLPSFDHSKTKFPLVGVHLNVQCDQCHKPEKATTKITEAIFHETPTQCAACHTDPHGGQFAKGSTTTCESCHTTDRWKSTHFDHERQSDFSLKGAHEKVACNQCHMGYRIVEGKSVLFYKPAPQTCSSCHN